MLPFSGDRRPYSAPAQPTNIPFYFSSLSPSAAPFTVSNSNSNSNPNTEFGFLSPPSPPPDSKPPPHDSFRDAWNPTSSWIDPPPGILYGGESGRGGYQSFLPPDDRQIVGADNCLGLFGGAYYFGLNGSDWQTEKYSGIHQGSSEAPSTGFSSSTLSLGGRSMPDSLLPDPCHVPKPYTNYDKYVRQLSSCSTDPATYESAVPSSVTSSVVCDLGKRTGASVDGGVLDSNFSFIPHANPCRISFDYFNYVPTEQKEQGQKTGNQHGIDWSTSADNLDVTSNDNERCLMENGFGLGNFVSHTSEAQCISRDVQLKFPNLFLSEVGSTDPLEFSPDLLELHNLVVDSPCWRGTAAACQFSFGLGENEGSSNVLKEPDECGDSHGIQKPPQFSIGNSEILSKHERSSTFNENQNGPSSSYRTEPFSAFYSPGTSKKTEDHTEINSVDLKSCSKLANQDEKLPEPPVNGEGQKDADSVKDAKSSQNGSNSANKSIVTNAKAATHIAKTLEEPTEGGESRLNSNTVVDAKNMIGSNQPSTFSPINDESTKEDGSVCSEKMSKSAAQEVQSNLDTVAEEDIVKKPSYGNAVPGCNTEAHCSESTLKGADHKVSSNKNQITEENIFTMPSLGNVTSSNRVETQLIKSMHNIAVVLQSTCNELVEPEHELLQSVIENLKALSSRGTKVELKAYDGMSNSNSENSYRKKPRMDPMSHSCNVGRPVNQVSEIVDTEFKKCISQALTKLPEDDIFEDDADFQILLYKNLWIEAEATLCTMKYELQLARMKLQMRNENLLRKASNEVKASRMSILKSPASMGVPDEHPLPTDEAHCTDAEPQDVNENKVDGVDASVMARFRVLKSRIDSGDSLNEGSSRQHFGKPNEVDTKQIDGVDASVMSRLSILKSRINSTDWLSEGSNKHDSEENKKKEDEYKDAVMARLQVLRARTEFLHPNDCCLGTKEAESIPSFTVTSSEPNNSSKGIDDSAAVLQDCINHASNEAAGERPVSEAVAQGLDGDQLSRSFVFQSPSSSSEWEHVLKEDFFPSM